MSFILFGFNAGLCALNAGLYINNPNPWSGGAAILCGFTALFSLVMAVVEESWS